MTLQDEDATNAAHRAKVSRTDSDGFEVLENLVTQIQSENITEDQSDKTLQNITGLFYFVQNLGTKMDSSAITLEIQMREGFVLLISLLTVPLLHICLPCHSTFAHT